MPNQRLSDASMKRQVDVAFVARPAVGVAGPAATAAVVAGCHCAILRVGSRRDGGSGFGFECTLLDGPLRVTIEGESVRNALVLFFFGSSVDGIMEARRLSAQTVASLCWSGAFD